MKPIKICKWGEFEEENGIRKKRKSPKKRFMKKRLVEGDKERKTPLIVLDECVYSPQLQDKLGKMEYNVMFLGSGLPDSKIREYMDINEKTVLVTADVEFDSWFSWKRCLLIAKHEGIQRLTKLIDEFMWRFKC